MTAVNRIISVAICLVMMMVSGTPAYERAEHRLVADLALDSVLAKNKLALFDSSKGYFCIPFLDSLSFNTFNLQRKIWHDYTFGQICSTFSGKDISQGRFHEPGKTIRQQLKRLKAYHIEKALKQLDFPLKGQNLEKKWNEKYLVEDSENVIANYLLHHIIALRFAKLAGEKGNRGKEYLRWALIYEAIAQGYLTDAFSPAHMFFSLKDIFSGFHCFNNMTAHKFYVTEGAFVINSHGEVWQTFGDKLLQWYAPTFRHVFKACMSSLQEIFLVFFVYSNNQIPQPLKSWGNSISDGKPIKQLAAVWIKIQDGDEYYSKHRKPTLLQLPMPISATWSVKSKQKDNHGIHKRIHYPQLLDFHDPDSDGIDKRYLYPKDAIAEWMILPDSLSQKDPKELIKSHRSVASVRYVQERHFPPSYVGPLLNIGGGPLFGNSETEVITWLGLGFGVCDNLFFLNKLSADVNLVRSLNEPRRLLLVPGLGASYRFSEKCNVFFKPFQWIEAVRVEGGYGWGLHAPYKSHGIRLAIGLETQTIPLGFTYAGVTIRLKYQMIWLESTIGSPGLEIILH